MVTVFNSPQQRKPFYKASSDPPQRTPMLLGPCDNRSKQFKSHNKLQESSPQTANQLCRRKKASWITRDVSYNFNCLQNCSQTNISLGFNVSQHCCNSPSVDGVSISDHHVTLEALLSCFVSFIQKGLILQQQLDCCIIANDQPNECGVISLPLSITMLCTTYVEISVTNTMTFCIFWFCWVAIDWLGSCWQTEMIWQRNQSSVKDFGRLQSSGERAGWRDLSRQHPADIPATCFKHRWLQGGKMKCANAWKDTLLSILQARGLLSTDCPWPITPQRGNHLNLPFARPKVLSLKTLSEGMSHHSTKHLF